MCIYAYTAYIRSNTVHFLVVYILLISQNSHAMNTLVKFFYATIYALQYTLPGFLKYILALFLKPYL
jgi:hypothetical protein